MKNIKGNIVFTMLLFLLCSASSYANWPVRDTLILDGDTIYIEKREKIVNLDSLQEELNEDIVTKRIPQHRLSMAFGVGWNQTVGNFHSAYQSYVPLDNFMGIKNSNIGNITPSVSIGCRLWNRPMKQGECQLSMRTGLAYNQISIYSTQMDEKNFQQDSIIKLDYVDDLLLLEYFTIFDTTDQGIIGELDTAIVNTERGLNRFNTWDIPLKLRVTYLLNATKISLFAEAGVIYRYIQSSNQSKTDNYIVNQSADYVRFDKSKFHANHIISPILTLGSGFHFIERSLIEKHWSLELSITTAMPSRTINREAYFSLKTWNYSFAFAVSRIF